MQLTKSDTYWHSAPYRSIRYLTFIAAAFLLPVIASAQRYAFKYYSHDDGLISLDVHNLIQDRTGYVWVATSDGYFGMTVRASPASTKCRDYRPTELNRSTRLATVLFGQAHATDWLVLIVAAFDLSPWASV
jgi:ligand-binding sensor domain-containing protein